MKVRTGIRDGHDYRPCADPQCGVSVDVSDMPWFTGPVFCSSRCQQRTPRAPVSAVKEARPDERP